MPIWHQSPKLTPRYFLETPRLFGYPHYSQQFTEIEKTTQSPYIKGLSGFESLCRVVKSMF